MASEPVAPDLLIAALGRAVEVAPAHAHHLPDLVDRLAHARLPGSDIGWAVRQFREPDGYLLAPAQEALLECYGGIRLASALDRHADRLRPVPVPPREAADAAEPDAPECPHRAQRRRSCQGQGREPSEDPEPPDPPGGPADDLDAEGERPVPASAPPPRAAARVALACLDEVDLCLEFRVPVPTLHCVPRFLVAGVRRALTSALRAVQEASHGGDATAQDRAWKLFLLLPRLLLRRSGSQGAEGRAEVLERIELVEAGSVERLLRDPRSQPPPARQARPDTDNARREHACARVRQGQLSRARQVLTAGVLAPGDDTTLAALRDPARRPPVPRQEIAAESLQVDPAHRVALTVQQVAEALRSTKRGAAPGLSGATAEQYKLLLDEPSVLEAFTAVVNSLARAEVPATVADALALSRLTALRKPNGGVRGIATGDVLRRLVSRVLARTFADVFDRATRPYQYALSTRTGTDALAAVLRAAVEMDPEAVVVSLEGRSAYDSISRAAIFRKLRDTAPQLVPFVRSVYARTSTFLWWDADGQVHEVLQAESVEQGDPLAPALYALGQHDALHAAAADLRETEFLAAFLDNLYVVTSPARASERLKTCVYSAAGGEAPPGIVALGEEVWRGDKPPAERGFVALGVPIGHEEYVQAQAARRAEEELSLLRHLPQLPDLQCAWLLLAFCAAPRAQHLLRNLPPASAAPYARAHDDAVWRALASMLGDDDPGSDAWQVARDIAFLPGSLGGLGLAPAERLSPLGSVGRRAARPATAVPAGDGAVPCDSCKPETRRRRKEVWSARTASLCQPFAQTPGSPRTSCGGAVRRRGSHPGRWPHSCSSRWTPATMAAWRLGAAAGYRPGALAGNARRLRDTAVAAQAVRPPMPPNRLQAKCAPHAKGPDRQGRLAGRQCSGLDLRSLRISRCRGRDDPRSKTPRHGRLPSVTTDAQDTHSRAGMQKTARRCESRSDASRRLTLNSRAVGQP